MVTYGTIGVRKFCHLKVPRELIFGKVRKFHFLFCKGKDFQEKSEKVIFTENQIGKLNVKPNYVHKKTIKHTIYKIKLHKNLQNI